MLSQPCHHGIHTVAVGQTGLFVHIHKVFHKVAGTAHHNGQCAAHEEEEYKADGQIQLGVDAGPHSGGAGGLQIVRAQGVVVLHAGLAHDLVVVHQRLLVLVDLRLDRGMGGLIAAHPAGCLEGVQQLLGVEATTMDVAIIKYNAGNIYSVSYALKRLGVEATITADPELLCKADKVIFPGVGEAHTTMEHLKEHNLDTIIKGLKQPVLGICLGMQLMCRHSEEGDANCLGIFDTEVKRFIPQQHVDKVPHMGWNTITNVKGGLFNQQLENKFVYFVHSYYVPVNEYTAATTEYILPFSASLHKDNFYATQFHPEKSGSVGEVILSNFLKL